MAKLPSIYPLYGSHFSDEVGIVVKPNCGTDAITDEDIANIAQDIIDKGLVEIPEDKFLKDVEFDHDKFMLTFNVGSENSEEVKPIAVSLAGMHKTYTAGDNVAISPKGEISVDLSGYVSKEGLEDKGYVTTEALTAERYVSEDTLEAKNYTTMADVEAKNYVDIAALEEKGYLTDVDALQATIATMEAKFTMLDSKYRELSKTDVEVKTDFVGGDILSDNSVDYVINSPALTVPTKIIGKSVEMNNASITPASAMESNVKRSPVAIEAKEVKIDGLTVNGSFNTTLNSNAVVAIENSAFVEIKNAVFDGRNFYNGFEIGLGNNLTILPKDIVFDGCHFKNYFTHNAFSIFRMQDNATITLNNCRFDDIVGVMRITNATKAKNITINVNNCVLESTEHNIGLILFQDHISKNADAFYENNMFGGGKITVSINNLIANSEKVVGDLVGLGAKQCAINVYAVGVKYLSYNEENKKYFPTVNIR